MNKPTGHIDRTDAALLVFLSLLWGLGFVFAGVALKELPPVTVVFGRVGFGALFLLPLVLLWRVDLPRSMAGWAPFFVMGVLNNVVPFALVAAGQAMTTTGLMSIINATTPLFTALVAAAFGEEKLTTHRLVGVLMGLAGVVILRGAGFDLASAQTVGILLCLGAALSYGFSGLWGRRMLKGASPLTSSFCQVASSSAVLLVLAIIIDRPWTLAMAGPATWVSLVGLGLFATSIAYPVFYRILARSGATNVMLVTLLMPVSTIVLAHFVLGDSRAARGGRRAGDRRRIACDRWADLRMAGTADPGDRRIVIIAAYQIPSSQQPVRAASPPVRVHASTTTRSATSGPR